MAMGVGPVLSQGAVDTLLEHASPELAEQYLEKMVSGEWTATMNITEPQAGSDLSGIRTKAELQSDGSYLVSGQKIFITYGEHDMTDNIIHLVLARLENAPEGTRGLSLFLVPKMLLDGTRNDLQCGGVEEKLGLHASPTCTMVYGENGGATGWLIGKENQGLKCMFTMMNRARLATGLQGVAIGERAWQQSLDYAQNRKQGKDAATGEKCSITAHPDVQRMLLTMRSLVAASRGLAYYAAGMIDRVESGQTEYGARANLLTPIVKAWCSEIGFEVASIGIQIHGGYGFVEETGAAQHLRDIRIASIYEGTNAIQAIDLINRKVKMTAGEPVTELLSEWAGDLKNLKQCGNTDLIDLAEAYAESLDCLEQATQWVLASEREMSELLAVADAYMQLFGHVAGHAMLIKAAVAGDKLRESDPEDAAKWTGLAVFYTRHIASKNVGYLKTVLYGSGALGMMGLAYI
jgi:alkylation response protein AidB-like acyl-CoA dehydrogenase